MGAAMSIFPDGLTLLPAERHDAQRRTRLSELGTTPEAVDALLEAATGEFDEFVARWVGWFPANRAAGIREILSDHAAALAQEIYQ